MPKGQWFTHQIAVAVLDGVRSGATVPDACRAAGTSANTLYTHARRDANLRWALDEALRVACLVVRPVGCPSKRGRRGPYRPRQPCSRAPARSWWCLRCGMAQRSARGDYCGPCGSHRSHGHDAVVCGLDGLPLGDHEVCGGGCPRCESFAPEGCGLLAGRAHRLARLGPDGLCGACARERDARRQERAS